jgi:hypothetical protein
MIYGHAHSLWHDRSRPETDINLKPPRAQLDDMPEVGANGLIQFAGFRARSLDFAADIRRRKSRLAFA